MKLIFNSIHRKFNFDWHFGECVRVVCDGARARVDVFWHRRTGLPLKRANIADPKHCWRLSNSIRGNKFSWIRLCIPSFSVRVCFIIVFGAVGQHLNYKINVIADLMRNGDSRVHVVLGGLYWHILFVGYKLNLSNDIHQKKKKEFILMNDEFDNEK